MCKPGILHPGAMGISIAAAAAFGDNRVYWVGEGRSAATRQRAAQHKLLEISLAEMCNTCRVIISVCPPANAEDVVDSVLANHFKGVFVDANAISPQRGDEIASRVRRSGASFVDGSIIGGPAWKAKETVLYLCGDEAKAVAELFVGSLLDAVVLDGTGCRASALKMTYAAVNKGFTALLASSLAAADALNVRDLLVAQWQRDGDKDKYVERITKNAHKSWRFVAEMHEISSTFKQVGQPDGFHESCADVYSRLESFKDDKTPSIDALLQSLRLPSLSSSSTAQHLREDLQTQKPI